jgi:phosphatidylglycerol:prolipoprotein diacylglycerol transferase
MGPTQAVIEIGIDPYIELGPLRLAWHGLMIAVGVAVGAWLAFRYARERGLDRERLHGAALILVLAGIVGAKLFWLLENDARALLRPSEWLGSRGASETSSTASTTARRAACRGRFATLTPTRTCRAH